MSACLLGCHREEEGVVAQPAINPNPMHAVTLIPSIMRMPTDVEPRSVNQYMIARYESRKLECSQIRHNSGGSVVNPRHEVPLAGDSVRGFHVWLDLLEADGCEWKLSLIRYGLSVDGERVLETAFSYQNIESAPLTYYCVWDGEIKGTCGMSPPTKGGRRVDDTTIIINVKED